MAQDDRATPWCTVILALAALACHTVVLVGNLQIAEAFDKLGTSSDGWADVGLSLSQAMRFDLDARMAGTSAALAATIDNVQQVQSQLDFAFGLTGALVDDIIDKYDRTRRRAEASSSLTPDGVGVAAGLGDPERAPGASETAAVLAASGRRTLGRHVLVHEAGVGTLVDAMWANVTGGTGKAPPPNDFRRSMHEAVAQVSQLTMGNVGEQLHRLLDFVRPALLQTGTWLQTFGGEIQGKLTSFSATLDIVQGIFDHLTRGVSSTTGAGEEQMELDTFMLLDRSKTGYISKEDLDAVVTDCDLVALQGGKAKVLFDMYDFRRDGSLSPKEYSAMVHDPAFAGIMPAILQTYAKQLASVAGRMGTAKMRDEVALAVADYFGLVFTNSSSVAAEHAEMLTKRALPTEFIATVLKNMALNSGKAGENAAVGLSADLSAVGAGDAVIRALAASDAALVADVLLLMTDPEFWYLEGFQMTDQSQVVDIVTQWVARTPQAQNVSSSLPAQLQVPVRALAAELRDFTAYRAERHSSPAWRLPSADFYGAGSSRALCDLLLGGVPATAAGTNHAQRRTARQGRPASVEAVGFAALLADHATAASTQLERQCFDYSSSSSSTVDKFVNKMQAMIKKMQSYLDSMEEYANPAGIRHLDSLAQAFASDAAADTATVLEQRVDRAMDDRGLLGSAQTDGAGGEAVRNSMTVLQEAKEVSGAVAQLVMFLTTLQMKLPAVVEELKFARKDVTSVSSTLEAVFTAFRSRTTSVFRKAARAYTIVWKAYFGMFALLQVAVVLYAFWSSGWLGGEAPRAPPRANPRTFKDRCLVCLEGCGTCVQACRSNNLCFWSMVLLMQLVVLLLFLISLFLCIMAGMRVYISSGCSAVYWLEDYISCQGMLATLEQWCASFLVDDPTPLWMACEQKVLLTCKVIGPDLMWSVGSTALGAMLAAIFTFQLVVESAILHARARWQHTLAEAQKHV